MSGRYDDATHAYFWNDERIPSVTQALKLAGYIDAQFYTPEAAARGTLVHAACEVLDKQPVASLSVARRIGFRLSPDIRPYVQAYARFLQDCRPEYDAIETTMYHPRLRYGGRTDRIVADLFRSPGILELKTGSVEPWHGYQTALYQLMKPTGARWVVYLGDNGRYRVDTMTNADDYRIGIDAIQQAAAALRAA